MRYHYTLTGMAKINLTIPSVDKDKAQQELSYILI